MSTQTIQKQSVPAGTWTIDPVHSSARFEVRHSGISTFRGGFGAIDARLSGGDEPRLEGSVEVASIDIDEEQLKGHLLSPEFFDAERAPAVRFDSREIQVGDDGEVEVRGELEIAATSREVEARGRLTHIPAGLSGKEVIGLSFEAAIDRSDFGLNWQAELPGGGNALDYEVKLAVELEFGREEV